MRPDPVISIIGIVRSENEVEVTSVARVRAVSTPPGRAVQLRARLRDAEGRELARAPVFELAAQGAECGCCNGGSQRAGEPPFIFQAMIPDVAPGAGLTISAGDKIIWERRAPEQTPKIGAVRAEQANQGTVLLAWTPTQRASNTKHGCNGRTPWARSGTGSRPVSRGTKQS